MFTCLFDPRACIASGFTSLLGAVPWWLWVAVVLLAIGLVWRLAGWPGLLGLAFGLGYFARDLARAFRIVRTHEPIEHVDGPDAEPPPARPKPKRRKTLQDLFREGLR